MDRRQWVLSVLEEHEGRLTRFAARILGDEESARDVVQHAFLRLCDQAPDQVRDRVAPWLFTVCRNRAVDLLRKRRRTVSLSDSDARERPGHEPDPAAAAERHDLYGQISELVAGLPCSQREAIDLWAEGFAYGEIAQITGHSEGNVRVLVHRALRTLRERALGRSLVDEPAPPVPTVEPKPASI